MGMTIEQAIYILENGLNIDRSWQKALNIALDTMRKYQQIEQILKDIPYDGEATVRRIQEVVEDGKID